MALLQLVDKATNELDNNHNSVGVFLDLSKASDTIIIEYLLINCSVTVYEELQPIGYIITSRIDPHSVYINGVNSKILPIIFGVPRGSVFGPLLFIHSINDIAQLSKTMELILLLLTPIFLWVINVVIK